MPQQPSRRDTPPGDSRALVRHHQSYLRSLDPGMLDGRWRTPQPVVGGPSELVGDSDDGDIGASDPILFENRDQFVIDGPGDKVFQLSFIPIDDGATSLQVFWIPLRMSVNDWTCVDNVLRVTDPGWRADDLVEVAYAYEYDGEPEPTGEIVPFESSGWKWLQVDSHDGNDYSSATFDDSAWASASAPFGETTPAHNPIVAVSGTWPDYVTLWEQTTKMWARRTIAAEPGEDLIVSLRWNAIIDVWLNGVDVYGTSTGGAGEATFVIDGSAVLASNQLTIKTRDDGSAGPGTGCYFDADISQALGEA